MLDNQSHDTCTRFLLENIHKETTNIAINQREKSPESPFSATNRVAQRRFAENWIQRTRNNHVRHRAIRRGGESSSSCWRAAIGGWASRLEQRKEEEDTVQVATTTCVDVRDDECRGISVCCEGDARPRGPRGNE
ncbi:hypothetical protein P5V15_010803 [Pogonomyrmex californicus]